MMEGCDKAEKIWLQKNTERLVDKSGSCAIVCLVTQTGIITANVGDSRAFLSLGYGKEVHALSIDHKPVL